MKQQLSESHASNSDDECAQKAKETNWLIKKLGWGRAFHWMVRVGADCFYGSAGREGYTIARADKSTSQVDVIMYRSIGSQYSMELALGLSTAMPVAMQSCLASSQLTFWCKKSTPCVPPPNSCLLVMTTLHHAQALNPKRRFRNGVR